MMFPVRRAFTLIELLIVIAILGILAAAIMVAINPGKRSAQAKDAIRKTNISQIKTALEIYYVENGQYPEREWVNSTAGELNWLNELVESRDLIMVPVDPINIAPTTTGAPWDGGNDNFAFYYMSNSTYFAACDANPTNHYILNFRAEDTSDSLAGNDVVIGDGSVPICFYTLAGWVTVTPITEP